MSYGIDLGQGMASGCDRGLLRTKKWPKKVLKMNRFSHTQKLMKNNENFSSQWQFLHSYRLSGVQGADNCQKSILETKTGLLEVEKMTKNDQN